VASSWVKKVSGTGICNFPTDTENFPQNFDRQLQMSDRGDHRCSKFQFWP